MSIKWWLRERLNREYWTQLLCRHQWKPSRFQRLGGGASFKCTKCGKYRHV